MKLIYLIFVLTIAHAADTTTSTTKVETKKSATSFEMITVPVKTALPGSAKEQPVSNQLSFELDPGAEMALGAQGGVAPISCTLRGVGTLTLNTDKTKCTYKAPDTGGAGAVKIKDSDNPPQTLNISIYSKVSSPPPPPITDCTNSPTRKMFSIPIVGEGYNVPLGCKEILVKAWGAGGYGNEVCGVIGGGSDYYGGGGGYAKAKVSVTPGERLAIYVGEGGKTEGAQPINGGGGLHGGANWGSGGGYSGVRNSSGQLILMAGGGGAAVWGCAGSGNGGGGGGLEGQTGQTGQGSGGKGGTQSNGGAAGDNICFTGRPVTAGQSLQGGNGCTASGGGGGYFGGGGATGGGGGGGSGFMAISGVTETKLIAGSKGNPAGMDDRDWSNSAGMGGDPLPGQHAGRHGRVVVCCTDPNVK